MNWLVSENGFSSWIMISCGMGRSIFSYLLLFGLTPSSWPGRLLLRSFHQKVLMSTQTNSMRNFFLHSCLQIRSLGFQPQNLSVADEQTLPMMMATLIFSRCSLHPFSIWTDKKIIKKFSIDNIYSHMWTHSQSYTETSRTTWSS